MQLSAGTGAFTTYDPSLNEYRYSGAWANTVGLSGQLQRQQHQYQLAAEAHWGQATPTAYNPLLYDYQRLHLQAYSLHLRYLRQLAVFPKMTIALGLGYQAQLQRLRQTYKNLLYASAEGTRRSYLTTLGEVALHLQSHYQLAPKHQLSLSGSYTPLSVAARPTDNYVNQGATTQSATWRLYAGKYYQAYRLSLRYQYSLTPGLALGLAAHTQYQHYHQAYAGRITSVQLSLRQQL